MWKLIRSRSAWSGPAAVLAAVCAALLSTVLVMVLLQMDRVPSEQPSNRIQGPQFIAAQVTGPSGARITCPLGSVPYVNITNAYFKPQLKGGTSFGRGTYQVVLTGTLVNETTEPIVITGLDTFVSGTAWRTVVVSRPQALAANSSAELLIHGQYTSNRVQPASVSTHMNWKWHDTALAPCGHKGLVDDD
jgi:hypothetical protein